MIWDAPEGAAGLGPSNRKLKIHRCCRQYDIKRLMWFTLQPNSKTEFGWWIVHKNFEKATKNLDEIRENKNIKFKYNVSVNNTILYFIYNKNSILSGRHVSTFIRSSSGPLRKRIQKISIFPCTVGSQIHWNIDRSWICFPRGPEDDLIKVETYHPDNILFWLCIN